MVIIGITGSLGAGKGTIVDYLVRTKDFAHFSVREYITQEVEKRGLSLNRDSLTLVANDLRAKNSPSYIIDEIFKQAQKQDRNCIIESIRTLGEIESLRKNKNFYLFSIDADPEIRFQRIKMRKSATDNIDFQKFIEDETREMTSTDPDKQNLQACIAQADYKFLNNGSIDELEAQVEKVLEALQQK